MPDKLPNIKKIYTSLAKITFTVHFKALIGYILLASVMRLSAYTHAT